MSDKKRAILSVSDKKGIEKIGKVLQKADWEIISTGGTANILKSSGVEVVQASDYTGQPEILDGRVKTLHPKILGGILGRVDQKSELESNKIPCIDLVIVNLYPFRETISNPEVPLQDALEKIDIGGPTMVRAAAKNHGRVAVVVEPEDYDELIGYIESGEDFTDIFLKRLAFKAFDHVSSYDSAIASFLSKSTKNKDNYFAPKIEMSLKREKVLRYGENPHQKGSFYSFQSDGNFSLSKTVILGGKELSFNNYLDVSAACELVSDLKGNACAILKHTNPCGVGIEGKQVDSYKRALACDPISAFGSVIGFNKTVSEETAEEMRSLFVEVVVAPEFDEKALQIFQKKKNLRILKCPGLASFPIAGVDVRAVPGGLLVQERDSFSDEEFSDWSVMTPRSPTPSEEKALKIAWSIVRHVKSNAIVLANETGTIGVGAGQMSRVDSTQLAVSRSLFPVDGCALASDAFFPFRDAIDQAAEFGVKAIIQPGGSVKDEEIIEAAKEKDIAMVFTGRRHFRH
tara:strand:+ start:1476 stop:3023 length:1548 start_codon:yes stop_codon:yes gene_type:complete